MNSLDLCIVQIVRNPIEHCHTCNCLVRNRNNTHGPAIGTQPIPAHENRRWRDSSSHDDDTALPGESWPDGLVPGIGQSHFFTAPPSRQPLVSSIESSVRTRALRRWPPRPLHRQRRLHRESAPQALQLRSPLRRMRPCPQISRRHPAMPASGPAVQPDR